MRNQVVSNAPAGGDDATGRDAVDWLSIAAAPTFAGMALLTAVLGDGATAVLCAQDASPLNGMALMYGLMSAFHSAPWLKLIARSSLRTPAGTPYRERSHGGE